MRRAKIPVTANSPLHAFVLWLARLQCNQAHYTHNPRNHQSVQNNAGHETVTIRNRRVSPISDLEKYTHAASQNLLFQRGYKVYKITLHFLAAERLALAAADFSKPPTKADK